MYHSKNKNIICVDCYAWRMLLTFRKNCIPKFRANTKKLKDLIRWDDLPRLFSTILRINSEKAVAAESCGSRESCSTRESCSSRDLSQRREL